MTTVADGRGDLVATVRNLAAVTAALREADDEVGRFSGRLADVSSVLADNRENLAQTLSRSRPTSCRRR